MASEWRNETCGGCGAQVERRWVVKTHKKGTPVPKGFHVERRGNSWNTVAGRTADVTLCMCDVAA